jgi:site-specific DNA-cytosine methylase
VSLASCARSRLRAFGYNAAWWIVQMADYGVPQKRRRLGLLGLAICRSIIRAHGGQNHAANRPTGGAEFTLSLPCEQPSSRNELIHVTADSD